LQWRT